MNRWIRTGVSYFVLWSLLPLFAQTMIGGSDRLALDTTTGDLTVYPSWHRDSEIALRLSTRWLGASTATLRVNGVEVDGLSADEEKDFLMKIPANSCGTYQCELLFEGDAYTRTIRTTGVRKTAGSTAVVLDTMTGSKIYTGKETLRYDTAWYANATSMQIKEGASTLIAGEKGDYAWTPSHCGEQELLLEALDGAAHQVASARANIDVQHNYVEQFSVAPTCTSEGIFDGYVCAFCGATKSGSGTVPALGHAPYVSLPAIAESCTTAGRTAEKKCSRCGETLTASEVIAALGHNRETTIAAVEPTCTTPGCTSEEKCSRCGLVFQQSVELAALGHAWTVTQPAVPATSGAPGLTEEISCSRCGALQQAATEIPALGYIRNVVARQLWPHKKVALDFDVADDIGEVVSTSEPLALSCKAAIVNTSTYPWSQDASAYKTAPSSWKSGGAGVSSLSTSYITCTVADATQVTFWWKVESESNYDMLHFYVDSSEPVTAISGSVGWTQVTVNLSSGTHTLKWSYTKDGWVGRSSDCGWVDDIQVTYKNTSRARTLIGDTDSAAGHHCVVWDLEQDAVALELTDLVFTAGYGSNTGSSLPVTVNTSRDVVDGMPVSGTVELGYSPIDANQVQLQIDGEALLSATNSGAFVWQPKTTGTHTLEHVAGTNHWTRTVNVTSLVYAQPAKPNPPSAEDANIMLGSTAKSMEASGDTFSIATSGSGTWTGSVSDDWIVFKGNSSKEAGLSAIVTVSANTGVESRTGYVYISGHVFTITQTGVGAGLEAYVAEFGPEGGAGEVLVLADGQPAWQVKAESDWISVTEVSGTGEAYVHYSVAPYAAVSDRTGYITIAGCSFEVHQIGRAMSISRLADEFDYLSHAVEIEVSAFSGTEWFVTPRASWISVVSPVSGYACGSGKALLTVNENPSYAARTGYVTIGTERYDVAQAGRPTPALAFAISPESTTASVNGANGLIAVTATPDLPWSAESQANWLTVMPTMKEGAGNGNIVYTATPNSTMSPRTGTIKVAAASASGMGTRTHSVFQPAAVAAIAVDAHTFAAEGDSFEVGVTIGENVNWAIATSASWVSIDGATSRIGPGTVKIAVAENQSIDSRTSTVTIAGHAFTVTQRGRTVEVEYLSQVFGPEGGDGTIEVHPNGTVNWSAVSSASWLTIWAEDGASDNSDGSVSGSGDGTIGYYVDPYIGDGESLTATITIGDKVVYITQRAYEASISPTAATVGGNAGAGEFGFSASIDDVWNALDILCSKDWITTAEITSFNATTKSGTIRYTYTANDSGIPRTGTICVAGETYEITQNARQLARIDVTGEGEGGSVAGGGVYDVGASVTIAATPADGYRFTGWSGASSATTATLNFAASVDRAYVAHFERIPVYVVNGEVVREGTVVTCTAPADWLDAAGTTKLVCLGTSAYPEKGTSFTLVASEDVSFEWDLWQTNYLLSVAASVDGQVKAHGKSGALALPAWVVAGEEVMLTATPDEGYTFMRWSGVADSVFRMDGPKSVAATFGVVGSLPQVLDATVLTFRTGGDGVWSGRADALAQFGYTAACATARPDSDTWLETTVTGAGVFAFNWRTECERDDSGNCEWDRLAVFTNCVEAARIDGTTGYQRVELPINGKTVIRWSFYRDEHDESDAPSEPKAWVDGVSWQEGF